MELFAIDLGNKQVKLKSKKVTKVLPSYFVELSEYGKRGAIGLSRSQEKDTHDYISLRDEDFTYVWGPGLDVTRKLVTDTIDFHQRYNSLEYKLLADFALAELARDFAEARKGMLDVVVVTGVPTDDYDKEGVLKQITNVLKGVHSVKIDGVDHNINVVDVYVLMQPTGTAIDIMVNDNNTINENNNIENGYVGIVDCGGGTVLIDAFEEMNLDTNNRVQLEIGSHKLFTEIRNAIIDNGGKITDHEVESMVRKGNEVDGYFWSYNRRVRNNLTDIVMRERIKYTRLVTRQVKNTFKDIAKMSQIYVTGGTANLLIESTFKTEIPIAKFVKNSELANVKGYYKYGVLNEVNKVDGGEE